jgi:hypothetical protein
VYDPQNIVARILRGKPSAVTRPSRTCILTCQAANPSIGAMIAVK